jgi:hypothetical protein
LRLLGKICSIRELTTQGARLDWSFVPFVAGLDGGAQEVRRAKRKSIFFSRCGPQWPTANFAFAFASWGK